MSPSICSQISILYYPLNLKEEIEPPPNYRPEIQLHLFDTLYNALLDSGTSVSAISVNLFKSLKNDPPSIQNPYFSSHRYITHYCLK